ncbi:glycosyl transferase family 25 [Aminobacter aminovorans]|uniref:Lipooligosaccharide biosynthesis protein lex-1 n=1 Tax=Aminobacter aminovorans TaxID=83263 RepID=A0A380WJP3_AMIAI|nr:glycosyltransferase family 25 protein [Aminobacter aminovorans]TCS29115.1 glycosyl transferase family 25 [Aminobacter aminovorans]SUU88968.1 Lipooligosaccharide biosynthesis protein lex-1 [Aminobacter aminovorans]
MNIYLINLDRSPERLARMAAIFGGLGLDFTRIPAVDGAKLIAEGKLRQPERAGLIYQLGPGETGCFLSHRACWQAIASAEHDHAAVFEDDVHFGSGLAELLSSDAWIPSDACVVKLETTRVHTLIERKRLQAPAGRSLKRLRAAHTGTSGYIISRAAARKLFDLSKDFADPVDQFMFNPACAGWAHLTTYQLAPAICIQDMFYEAGGAAERIASTLDNERPELRNAKKKLSKPLRELIRPLQKAWWFVDSRMRGLQRLRVPFG